MSHNNKFILIAAASLMLAACSSVPPAPSAAPVAPISVVSVPARAAPVAPMTASVLLPHLDPNSKISTERSVYFDFDNYMIKPEFAATIQMHASY
ncbi:MAG: peptidoglycan-associated lipoprotein, partial [Massilia sp.]|nr:peptidoglycan-associated lipoprotein [Massilia sp.]